MTNVEDAAGQLTVSSLFVDSEALPTPPVTVLEVVRRADDPDVQIEDLAKLIETDVALSVQLIRMSNSSLYAPVKEITTIERAIATLGLRSVRLLALTTSLRALLPQDERAFDMSEIRRRMVVNGAMSRAVAEKLERRLADEAFTCGLLSGLGRIVLATKAPEVCAAAVEAHGGWPTLEAERAFFGFSGDEVTTALIRTWGLPSALADAIDDRTSPPDDAENNLVRSLRLGLLAEEVLCGPNPGRSLQTLLERSQDHLGMTDDELSAFVIESEQLVADTAEALRLPAPSTASHADLLLEATTRMQALTLEAHASIMEGSREVQELSRRNEELRVEATTDSLTGLFNRSHFDDEVERLTAPGPARRSGDDGVALLLFDLDRFKVVNDTHGHVIGDAVLQAVGAALLEKTRPSDLAARYGGEEFVVLFPRVSREQLEAIAERFRAAIADIRVPLPGGDELAVTASFGGAMLGEDETVTSGTELIARADERLYEAKRAGRNRTVLA